MARSSKAQLSRSAYFIGQNRYNDIFLDCSRCTCYEKKQDETVETSLGQNTTWMRDLKHFVVSQTRTDSSLNTSIRVNWFTFRSIWRRNLENSYGIPACYDPRLWKLCSPEPTSEEWRRPSWWAPTTRFAFNIWVLTSALWLFSWTPRGHFCPSRGRTTSSARSSLRSPPAFGKVTVAFGSLKRDFKIYVLLSSGLSMTELRNPPAFRPHRDLIQKIVRPLRYIATIFLPFLRPNK